MLSCFLASFTTNMSVYSTKNVLAPGVGFEPTTNWLHLPTSFLSGVDYIIIHKMDARRFGPSVLDGPTPFRDSLWTFPEHSGLGCWLP